MLREYQQTVGDAGTAITALHMQVLMGMDHVNAERDTQLYHLKRTILEHVDHHEQSLLVIEEYDKMDCPTRGFFRQLVTSSHTANVSLAK